MVLTSNLFVIAAGVVAFIALVIFLNAVTTARRGQRAAYYSVRRDAQRAANRLLMLSFVSLLLAAGIFGGSFIMQGNNATPVSPASPLARPSPQVAAEAETQLPPTEAASSATPKPAQKPSTTATASAAPSATAKATQIPEPTSTLMSATVSVTNATAIPEPTSALISVTAIVTKATPIPEPTSTLVSATATTAKPATELPTLTPSPVPSPSPAQALPNDRLTLHSIAAAVDTDGSPIDPRTTFPAGLQKLYIFFEYRDVPPSALLRHSWFRNGGMVYYYSQRFPGENATGVAYVEWAPPNGFEAGLYEVRVQLGGVQQFVANFEVQ